MTPKDWQQVVDGPCFVINLDRRPDKWAAANFRVTKAGFNQVIRVAGVDGHDLARLTEAWASVGNPKFDQNDGGFVNVPGKQGCFLSHVSVWRNIVEKELEFATVFEDDAVFHPKWNQLAPVYFDYTPKNYDVLFLGAQFDFNPEPQIVVRGPVFCTHAMLITHAGAEKLLRLCLQDYRVRTVDCLLIDEMRRIMTENDFETLRWYCWHGNMFPTQISGSAANKKNSGLVFQDPKLNSDIFDYNYDKKGE